ncbi:hypothetical protein ACOKSZ_00285 [Propionibacteriaceae bacterium Y1685]
MDRRRECCRSILGRHVHLVGNTAATGLVNHDAANPATLAFETNPDNLALGDVVNEIYYVALGTGTTDDANVTFTATSSE